MVLLLEIGPIHKHNPILYDIKMSEDFHIDNGCGNDKVKELKFTTIQSFEIKKLQLKCPYYEENVMKGFFKVKTTILTTEKQITSF